MGPRHPLFYDLNKNLEYPGWNFELKKRGLPRLRYLRALENT